MCISLKNLCRNWVNFFSDQKQQFHATQWKIRKYKNEKHYFWVELNLNWKSFLLFSQACFALWYQFFCWHDLQNVPFHFYLINWYYFGYHIFQIYSKKKFTGWFKYESHYIIVFLVFLILTVSFSLISFLFVCLFVQIHHIACKD